MFTEDDYLEIKQTCVFAIDAIEDALSLCNRFLRSEKKMITKLKRCRSQLMQVVEMCKDKIDMDDGRFPMTVAGNLSNEKFIDVICFKYDMKETPELEYETEEEKEEGLAYELLGGIICTAYDYDLDYLDAEEENEKRIVDILKNVDNTLQWGLLC